MTIPKPLLFALLLGGLAGCGLPGPVPAEYVLGDMPAATASAVAQTGFPVVELKRIQLPDYLDNTAILERRGNQMVASPTARWGERLSLGMRRALAVSLAGRLPRMAVTAAPPAGPAAWQVLVDVTAFERQQSRIVLAARWSIADGSGRTVLETEQVVRLEDISGPDDAAVVAAMSRALEDLAGRLAEGLSRVSHA